MTVGLIPTGLYNSTPINQNVTIVRESGASIVFLGKSGQYWKKMKENNKDDFPNVRHVILPIGTETEHVDKRILPWRLFVRNKKNVSKEEYQKLKKEVRPSSIATIVYTPGTEGKPKGVLLSHQSILNTARGFIEHLNITEEDTYVSYLSPASICEQMLSIYVPALTGHVVHFAPAVEETQLQMNLRELQPTIIAGPHEFWFGIYLVVKEKLESKEKTKLTEIELYYLRSYLGFARLEKALLGGPSQSAPPEMYEFFKNTLGVELCEVYGQAETCGITALNSPKNGIKFNTVGKLFENRGATIQKHDQLKNGIGEICLKHDTNHIFTGYFKGSGEVPTVEKEALKGGIFYTGDLVQLSGKEVVYHGRKSALIKLANGNLCNPYPLERALTSGWLLRNALVVGQGEDFVGSLLVLDLTVCKRKSLQYGIDAKTLLGLTETKLQLRESVWRANALSTVGKISKSHILHRHFSIRKQEITAAMSVRRHTVQFRNHVEIGNMYNRKSAVKVPQEPLDLDPSYQSKTDGVFYVKVDGDYQTIKIDQEYVSKIEAEFSKVKNELMLSTRQFSLLQQKKVQQEKKIKSLNEDIKNLQEKTEKLQKVKDETIGSAKKKPEISKSGKKATKKSKKAKKKNSTEKKKTTEKKKKTKKTN
eukprot:TRINITY_DN5113_c0_g1_i2.p1 TRINITY_DN5113_c0_g1~~TRINITY_DN5113_c0_g1_i2.p1  ORF type:complete len:649 (+),score=133.99 TRINITY_DN5113_c0_g1_i2:36-1982(+)